MPGTHVLINCSKVDLGAGLLFLLGDIIINDVEWILLPWQGKVSTFILQLLGQQDLAT